MHFKPWLMPSGNETRTQDAPAKVRPGTFVCSYAKAKKKEEGKRRLKKEGALPRLNRNHPNHACCTDLTVRFQLKRGRLTCIQPRLTHLASPSDKVLHPLCISRHTTWLKAFCSRKRKGFIPAFRPINLLLVFETLVDISVKVDLD